MTMWNSIQPWLKLAERIYANGWARVYFMLDGESVEMYIRYRSNRSSDNTPNYHYRMEGKFEHSVTFNRTSGANAVWEVEENELTLFDGVTLEEAEEAMVLLMLQVEDVLT